MSSFILDAIAIRVCNFKTQKGNFRTKWLQAGNATDITLKNLF